MADGRIEGQGRSERGSGGAEVIQSHEELEVYKLAFEASS
jgi:hypothetical protein